MPDIDHVMSWLGWVVVAAPALPLVLLGVPTLLGRKLQEQTITRTLQWATATGLLAAIGVLVYMLIGGSRHVVIEPAEWVVIPGEYHFSLKFVFDRLSVPFTILSFVLGGTIGAFGRNYMHREHGFNRFFVLYALFMFGMVTTALAGTIETLFAGWELVGLSSALLVAFFQERPAPARNGLRVWVVYRVADAAFLLAAVVMHNMRGGGDFDELLGAGPWPLGRAAAGEGQALVVGLLLLVAAAGKSGLVPFSGWLPRAMEGPTPSSAVFYAALSVHLGAYLLLRVSPLLACSVWLCAAVVALGLLSAVFAYLTASVQTDIKSALSFAALSQVGLIVAEVGAVVLIGNPDLLYLPLIHMLGHACLRTLQFVRAPTLLQDYRTLENAMGNRLPRRGGPLDRLATVPVRTWLYRLALERGYLDALLADYVVGPFLRALRWCDGMERRWTDFLSGQSSRASDQVKPYSGRIEELS